MYLKLTFLNRIPLNLPKHRISCHFEQLSAPPGPIQKPHILTKGVHPRAHILPKSLHKNLLPENEFQSNFFVVEILLKCPKVIYLVILSIFQPLWATQKPHILAKKYIRGLIFSQ